MNLICKRFNLQHIIINNNKLHREKWKTRAINFVSYFIIAMFVKINYTVFLSVYELQMECIVAKR